MSTNCTRVVACEVQLPYPSPKIDHDWANNGQRFILVEQWNFISQ